MLSTHDAVVELAFTVGKLVISMTSLRGAVAQTLNLLEPLENENALRSASLLQNARTLLAESEAASEEAWQNLVTIMTGLQRG